MDRNVTLRELPSVDEVLRSIDSRFPRDAARVLRKVVEAEPGNSAAWELLGRAHFAAAHLPPAEEAFRRLVELEPTSMWAQTALVRAKQAGRNRCEVA